METQPEQKMTIDEALIIINEMYSECGTMGANGHWPGPQNLHTTLV